jgi:hypothetical protein
MDRPQTLFIPVTVVERPVWLLNDEQRKTTGITVEQRSMGGHTYDLYYLHGQRIDPNEAALVPIRDDDM